MVSVIRNGVLMIFVDVCLLLLTDESSLSIKGCPLSCSSVAFAAGGNETILCANAGGPLSPAANI